MTIEDDIIHIYLQKGTAGEVRVLHFSMLMMSSVLVASFVAMLSSRVSSFLTLPSSLPSPLPTCHSLDGAAGVGPTWQGLWGAARPGSESGTVDDAYIAQSIVAPNAYMAPGFAGGMPSYEGQLDETQQAAIAAFIRSINGAATAADTTLAADPAAETP